MTDGQGGRHKTQNWGKNVNQGWTQIETDEENKK